MHHQEWRRRVFQYPKCGFIVWDSVATNNPNYLRVSKLGLHHCNIGYSNTRHGAAHSIGSCHRFRFVLTRRYQIQYFRRQKPHFHFLFGPFTAQTGIPFGYSGFDSWGEFKEVVFVTFRAFWTPQPNTAGIPPDSEGIPLFHIS